MTGKNKLIKFLGRLCKGSASSPIYKQVMIDPKMRDMLTEIKGMVTSYPIILTALKEANKNIDAFIKSNTQPTMNAKELYKQWAKEMLEIHGEMTPHYWAAGESMFYWLQSRQPEKLTVTREEVDYLLKQWPNLEPRELKENVYNWLGAMGLELTDK